MTSVAERPTVDLHEIMPHADAERLIDALARILLAAAKVRAARETAEQSAEAES